ncbi:winged helix-turn-helix domain-containing protein [Peristeroidobacter soli]|uniref:winged helix-turn-helix domain-containing protein n=1 Tax=Peristeroidobacter soli TaxID=2497877 RepID=UPI00101CC83B|nr:winged helix-turn-helix domain-containing protein [Peristeroidobacter soli]
MAPGRFTYEFGDFRLDVARRLLLPKRGDRALPLTARAFDTLLYLVEHPGKLLSKATLLGAIWPNVVVEENSLNQNISLLRRVLGEHPGEYRFIVTVPGRGYRFVAEVRTVSEPADERRRAPVSNVSEPAHTRAAPHARIPLAILPFANLSSDPATDYFGEGMAEELINTFARVRWFEVASRTSTFAFKDRNVDVRKIARELDVEAVLEGSIRRVGERIRVTAQLVDGRSGHHLWSESYERGCDDLTRVQDELTVAIVDSTASHFVIGSARRKTPTRDLEAYHLYLQAMTLRAQPSEDNLETAVQILDRALARDPDFARAWYAIAEARAHRAANDGCALTQLNHAERDARHALALDPSISRAHGVLGLINACCGRWIAAETELRKALSLVARNPDALVFHAIYVARQAGHHRKALAEIQLAYQFAPSSPALALHLGAQKLLDGDPAEACKWIDLAIANGYPRDLAEVREARAQLAMREGRFDEAAQELTETLSPISREAGGFEAIQSFYRAQSDPSRNDRAIAALQAWETKLPAEDLEPGAAHRLMVWYTMLRAIDAAHDVAQRLIDRLASRGTIGNGWGILWTREMQTFRASPRFQQLLSRLGLLGYWRQYGPPDNYVLRGDLLHGS